MNGVSDKPLTYQEEFAERVEALFAHEDYPPVEDRKETAEKLTEEHFEITRKFPKPYLLEKLANYILLDTLRDRNIHKAKHDEYPVFSKYQEKKRARRQILVEDDKLDWFNERNKNNPNTRRVRTRNMDE